MRKIKPIPTTVCENCGSTFISDGKTLCPLCRAAKKNEDHKEINTLKRAFRKILSADCERPVCQALTLKEWEEIERIVK